MANEQKHPRLPIVTSTGRLVAGDLQKASDIGHGGKKREVPQFYFALAIPKSDPHVQALLGQIFHHTLRSYAHVPNIAQLIQANSLPGPYVPEPQRRPFAWKIQDGDWPSNSGREGHAGCWIFGFATSGSFNICDINGAQVDPARVHLGMYAQVSGNVTINGLTDANCGIYVNPQYVKIIADGPLIVTGPTADQAFANAPAPQLPPGAVAFTAGGYAQPPAQQQYAQPPAQQQYAPPPAQQQYAPPPAQQQYAQPPAQQQYAPPPAPAPLPPQAGNYAPAPVAPAYQQPPTPAPYTAPTGYPATASPSNAAPLPQGAAPAAGAYAPPQYAAPQPQPAGYPPVQPHTAFTQ